MEDKDRHIGRRWLRRLAIVAINFLVFVGGLLAIEFGFRAANPNMPTSAGYAVWLQFQPYVMTSVAPNARFKMWYNEFKKAVFDTDFTANNFGYSNRGDFDITKPYVKGPNEKVILFTGGSTAFGVGATSNANVTHERLAALLNAAQDRTRYTAINLGNGGWIAHQENIALDLWGRLYNPDWVIALDGANDAAVGCSMSQGTGNPIYFQLIKSLVMGYLGTQLAPEFYRGAWENELIRYSVAYRSLTGKQYIPRIQEFDKGFVNTKLQVIQPTPLSEIRNQVAFYVLSQKSILERFQDAKYILSTQPNAQDFTYFFGDFYRPGESYSVAPDGRAKFGESLEQWLDSYKPGERRCSSQTTEVSVATRYVFGMGSIRLAETVEDYRKTSRRDVEYYNMGVLFPKNAEKRQAYFIDNYHLSDAGLDRLARYYAYNILKRDFPNDDWSALRSEILSFNE